MAGARAFERGEDYCAGGPGPGAWGDEEGITAKVLGTRDYRVKLWVENGDSSFRAPAQWGPTGRSASTAWRRLAWL